MLIVDMSDRQGPQTVMCHSCQTVTHGEHIGPCDQCNNEREYCCLCWESEDMSCGVEYEHDHEPA